MQQKSQHTRQLYPMQHVGLYATIHYHASFWQMLFSQLYSPTYGSMRIWVPSLVILRYLYDNYQNYDTPMIINLSLEMFRERCCMELWETSSVWSDGSSNRLQHKGDNDLRKFHTLHFHPFIADTHPEGRLVRALNEIQKSSSFSSRLISER